MQYLVALGVLGRLLPLLVLVQLLHKPLKLQDRRLKLESDGHGAEDALTDVTAAQFVQLLCGCLLNSLLLSLLKPVA